MSSVFIYVIDRDFGFAPNPFHGTCTLATCKPRIRRAAAVGDWVIGMGGRRLNATGRCVFAMRVSRKIDFNTYWTEAKYRDKKPVRNGSQKMMVGDNIYHHAGDEWIQLDSHHSHPDGTQNSQNVINDTTADSVLISDHFYYFGKLPIEIPVTIMNDLGYRNRRNHRRFAFDKAKSLLDFLRLSAPVNRVLADPHDFDSADARYSHGSNKIVKARV